MAKLLIVEDSPHEQKSIAALLEGEEGIEVVSLPVPTALKGPLQ